MKYFLYICLSFVFLFLPDSASAQQVQRPVAISAYIYNFAKNVQWQREDAISEFNFLIIGQDEKLLSEMRMLSKNKKLRDKPIKISSSVTPKEINKAHLIFLTKGREEDLVSIFDQIEGKNVLLISDGYPDKRLIMINFYDSDKGTLLFEINKANIINQHLSIMQDMILLGGTEVDVATLYREGQQSLRSLQKYSETLENNLTRLENNLAVKTREIQESKDSLSSHRTKIHEQQEILDSQSQLLKQREKELATQIMNIQEQQQIFGQYSREIEKQGLELKQGNEILLHQKAEIDRQKAEILIQSKIQKEQGLIIHRQKNLMYILVMVIVFIGLLIMVIFNLYKGKQKLNRELEARVEERTNDLHLLNEKLQVELSERKLAEKELEKYRRHLEERVAERTSELQTANERLGAIFDATNIGIVVLQDRVIQNCNSRLEEIFGYEPGEMIGKPTRIWYLDEDSYNLGGDPVQLRISRGETHQREQVLRKKDGSTFLARLTGRILDLDNPAKGMVGVIEDVTLERENEQSLKNALEAAMSADRLKSAFLATMSHELRTPLNSIIGFTGMLMMELPGPLNDEQKKQLGMTQKSSRHLLSLINDILDLSKIEAGQLKLSIDNFQLSEVIENTIELSKPLAESKKIKLTSSVDPLLTQIESDKFRVQQVILNLVTNALKFTEEGSVHVEALKIQDKAVIKVIDTGIGIEADQMENLFKPFIQIDSEITRKHEGTGLGLSISNKLVALLGGSIRVESEYGKGSTFIVSLPVKNQIN